VTTLIFVVVVGFVMVVGTVVGTLVVVVTVDHFVVVTGYP